jgi:outer membrane protein OmpA-like peptidoglycan-associated protein
VVEIPADLKENLVVTQTLTISPKPIEVGADLAKIYEINPIYFDVNKNDIRPDAAIELDKIIAIMNENPGLVIELGAHTDCRGNAAYNRSLSDRRAKASAAYIKARISNPNRITGKGYGESQLLNDCACEGNVVSTCSDEEHQENRRTEFKVVAFKEQVVKKTNNVKSEVTETEQAEIESIVEEVTETEQVEIEEIVEEVTETEQPAIESIVEEVTETEQPAIEEMLEESAVQEELQVIGSQKLEVGADLAKIYEIQPIYFDVNKNDIRPDAAIELDKIIAIMNDNPGLKIELGSHTDCRGNSNYNRYLSDRRAKASAAYIKERISNPKRITAKGYGELQLLNDCGCEGDSVSTCSEEEHQLNRRTEFKVVAFEEKVPKTTKNEKSVLKDLQPVKEAAPSEIKESEPVLISDKTTRKKQSGTQVNYPAGFEEGADLMKLLEINSIYFDLDRTKIRPDAALELDKIVAVMKEYPRLKVQLVSHTDCRMTEAYNLNLSKNRAENSKLYLVRKGIRANRISTLGMGESSLAVDCPCEGEQESNCSEEQHQLNRRTECLIIKL